jgi:hypothetical protein
MPSITETTDSGFYVTHLRNNVRLSCRCKTRKDSEEALRKMMEDVVVSLPRKQVHFLPDKILIIKKGIMKDKKYRNPYIMTDFDFDIQKRVLKNNTI